MAMMLAFGSDMAVLRPADVEQDGET